MMGKIGIKDHRIECIIGDLPQERSSSQTIYVDVEIERNFASTDKLDDTFCYAKIADICTDIAKSRNFRLLETYAVVLVKHLREVPGVGSIFVRIKKPGALPTAEYAYVEMRSS